MKKKDREEYSFEDENNETGYAEETFTGYKSLPERKAAFIHTINNMSLQEFERLEHILKSISQDRLPCQFTQEEKIHQLEEGDRQVAAGQYIPAEEVMNRYKHLHS